LAEEKAKNDEKANAEAKNISAVEGKKFESELARMKKETGDEDVRWGEFAEE